VREQCTTFTAGKFSSVGTVVLTGPYLPLTLAEGGVEVLSRLTNIMVREGENVVQESKLCYLKSTTTSPSARLRGSQITSQRMHIPYFIIVIFEGTQLAQSGLQTYEFQISNFNLRGNPCFISTILFVLLR
jgi:hypothetical protein